MSRIASLKLFAILSLVLLAIWPSVANGQQPQSRVLVASDFPVANPPKQFDEIVQVIDIAAGATTAPSSYGGDEYVSVIEGQVTLRELAKPVSQTVFGTGSTFVQGAGQMYQLVNAGQVRARLLSTILLPKGTALTPDGTTPSGLTVAFKNQREYLNPLAQFHVIHNLVEFDPGAFVPAHTHGGDVLGVVVEGQITNRDNGVEIKMLPGDGFTENAGHTHSIGNSSNAPAEFFASLLLPLGAQPITIEAAPNTVPTTGAPGQDGADLGFVWLVGAILIAGGLLLRKRFGQA